MSDYDYGNARLRAMKSRLLSSGRLLLLAESKSIDLLITDLSDTPYRQSAEIALIRAVGFERVSTLLQHHLVETVAKIRHFYRGVAEQLLLAYLMRYDVHNLKTILRGLSHHVPSIQMTNALLPIGELTYSALSQLIGVENHRTAIDMLASMRFSIATPLVKLRDIQPNATITEMELCLEQWYFDNVRETIDNLRQHDTVLTKALMLEADVINLLTSLRFVHAPAEQERLLEQLQIHHVSELYVQAGNLSYQFLAKVVNAKEIQTAIDLLSSTRYGAVLADSLNTYHKTRLLSEFERGLRHYRTRILARNIVSDPLGIGISLGYLALKENEIHNIRAIAWGIQLGQDSDIIKQNLEFVA